MANWAAIIYDTLAAAETAIETIDDGKEIVVAAFKEGALQKVLVAEGNPSVVVDTLKFVAAGSKTIASAAEKYLSIDSGTDGAEIVSITIKGVVGADWTIELYIPTEDAVAAPAAGDKRDEDTYLNGEDKGGQLSIIGAIRYNMFLDITNDSGGSDNIDEVIVAYRSAGTLTLAWEA